jgi:ribosome recycling factor
MTAAKGAASTFFPAGLESEADEDEKERGQKELQKMVDDANGKVEEAAKKKEQEIMTV